MSVTGHLAELERKHEALNKKIEQELIHPHKDGVHIVELKRKKLVLKDQIAKLRQISASKIAAEHHQSSFH